MARHDAAKELAERLDREATVIGLREEWNISTMLAERIYDWQEEQTREAIKLDREINTRSTPAEREVIYAAYLHMPLPFPCRLRTALANLAIERAPKPAPPRWVVRPHEDAYGKTFVAHDTLTNMSLIVRHAKLGDSKMHQDYMRQQAEWAVDELNAEERKP